MLHCASHRAADLLRSQPTPPHQSAARSPAEPRRARTHRQRSGDSSDIALAASTPPPNHAKSRRNHRTLRIPGFVVLGGGQKLFLGISWSPVLKLGGRAPSLPPWGSDPIRSPVVGGNANVLWGVLVVSNLGALCEGFPFIFPHRAPPSPIYTITLSPLNAASSLRGGGARMR